MHVHVGSSCAGRASMFRLHSGGRPPSTRIRDRGVEVPDVRSEHRPPTPLSHPAVRPAIGGRMFLSLLRIWGRGRKSLGAILAPPLYANSVQIGLIEPHDPGLAKRETEVFLEHGLEDGSGYPLRVDEDAARHAGVHRLEKVAGAFRDYDNVVVALQVPALQLAIGGGVQGDAQRPGESFSYEFEEGNLCAAVFLFHAERVVLL